MNLNEQELPINPVGNVTIEYTESRKKISFLNWSFQISRILLRPINKAEVIVKATSKKPK